MAHLIAWIIVLPIAIAWFAVSSALWTSFVLLGWKRSARAIGAGPIVPLERAVARALESVHEALWGVIGAWTLAVYAAIVLILMYIGSP